MQDITSPQLDALMNTKPFVIAYFHTPTCGTCRIAEKMLTVAMETLSFADVYRCNINLMPQRATEWEITSIPCLLILQNGFVTRRVYAFQSVTHVYELLRESV